jgi:hypothetical protein
MIKATITHLSGSYVVTTESGVVIDFGRRKPSSRRIRKSVRAALGEEVLLTNKDTGSEYSLCEGRFSGDGWIRVQKVRLDANLREIAKWFRTASELQTAITTVRARLDSGLLNQQQTELTRESLDNYLRIAAVKRWPCK